MGGLTILYHCVVLGAADAGVKLVGDIGGVTGESGSLKQVKDVVGISKDTVGLGKSAVTLGKAIHTPSKDGKEDKKEDKLGQAEKGLDLAEKGISYQVLPRNYPGARDAPFGV